MTTYLQQTGGKSYIKFETSWILCTLSNKLPRPGTVLPTGFAAKDSELQLKKTLRICNFQCVPSLWCCEEWTDLALLPAIVVTCSYWKWSCSAYWTVSNLHAHYLWYVPETDRMRTEQQLNHPKLMWLSQSWRAASHPLFMKIPTGILQHLDEVTDKVAKRMQKSTILSFVFLDVHEGKDSYISK